MFSDFSHYLSYGATDQQTARELTGEFDGLLVPGTVAAFQADGTKGFVLTLSAAEPDRTRYIIDPRSPLFQQPLAHPKKSHTALAEVLGDPSLVTNSHPDPDDFDDERVRAIATSWAQFNLGYTTLNSKHFSKYAQRLNKVLVPQNVSRPEAVLAPYFMSAGTEDPWWSVSTRLWEATKTALSGDDMVVHRVVGARGAHSLEALLADTDTEPTVIWVDGLDEFDVEPKGLAELTAYGAAVKRVSDERPLFSLYGGYFAVMLRSFGLRGCSHGIGYGEYRAYIELPNSGPPPARYYLPKAHKYVSQDLAEFLSFRAPELVDCECPMCADLSPGDLDYHALMKHSVYARAEEIRASAGVDPSVLANRLDENAALFDDALEEVHFPKNLGRQARNMYGHLSRWADCVRAIDAM